jgi:alpha-L-rhamnosidase
VNWEANWIWNQGEASPRNEWWCFRKSFDIPDKGWDKAKLYITADSRYVLYINGERVGRGPARSWPSAQKYDVYEIRRFLRPGRTNVISVLVLHFGVSTFYYLRGRGGLLAQLELLHSGQTACRISTDETWKVSRCPGQNACAPRMSSQNAFAEMIDGRKWNDSWVEPDYCDAEWQVAVSIGPAGMKPWSSLFPRDIPFLTEEIVYPSRVESLAKVKPVRYTTHIDLRNHMVPGSEDHMNTVMFSGYLAVNICAHEDTGATFGFMNPVLAGPMRINGFLYDESQFYGEAPERYVDAKLMKGDNLLLIDISGADLAVGFYMGIDCDAPFDLLSPLGGECGRNDSPFVAIGPFETSLNTTRPVDQKVVSKHGDYLSAARIADIHDLDRFRKWIRPIPWRLVSDDNVFFMSVWVKKREPQPIPEPLHALAFANVTPAALPLYDGWDTELIVDFGKISSGFIAFEVEASPGTVLDFYGFEYMSGDWRQETYKLNNTLRYVCRDGHQIYASPVRRGLRYVMVTVRQASAPVQIYNIQMIQSTYPVAEIGRFQCSDPLLNDIWEISRHTVKLCMEDTFVDCPTYEQTFWVGDARNEALMSYYLFGASDIVKNSLQLVPGSRHQTPYLASQVPSGWSSVIPNWTFFWVIACLEYYEQTGHRDFVLSMWPHTRDTLEHYLFHLNSEGLLDFKGWNLLDWAPMEQPNDGIVTHQNLFMAKALSVAGKLARISGQIEEARRFENASCQLIAAVNRHLWSEERSAYVDCIYSGGRISEGFSMQTQVVALLCGAAEGERKQKLRSYLLAPPKDFVQIGSPFMSFFYYEALEEIGEFKPIIEDIRKNYGQMIEADASACWEMFPNSTNRDNPKFLTRSHCHAWSAAPAYFFGTTILGVRKAAAGWKKVRISPNPSGLVWARGSVPLPERGRIDVSWQLFGNGTKIHLRVKAPSEVELELCLPDGLEGDVSIIKE